MRDPVIGGEFLALPPVASAVVAVADLKGRRLRVAAGKRQRDYVDVQLGDFDDSVSVLMISIDGVDRADGRRIEW